MLIVTLLSTMSAYALFHTLATLVSVRVAGLRIQEVTLGLFIVHRFRLKGVRVSVGLVPVNASVMPEGYLEMPAGRKRSLLILSPVLASFVVLFAAGGVDPGLKSLITAPLWVAHGVIDSSWGVQALRAARASLQEDPRAVFVSILGCLTSLNAVATIAHLNPAWRGDKPTIAGQISMIAQIILWLVVPLRWIYIYVSS